MKKTIGDRAIEQDDGMLEMVIEDETQFMEAFDAVVERKNLVEDVSALYVAGQIPSKRRNLHLSDVIGRSICPRKMVLLHYYEQDQLIHGHQLSARFETGNAIHKRWQGNIGRATGTTDIERTQVETIWNVVHFSPDQIAPFRGEMHVWEYKGYNDGEFRLLTLKGKLPKEAILQNMLYQHFNGVRWGLIVVENKNTQAHAVWRIAYDYELVAPVIPLFERIVKWIRMHKEEGKTPARLEKCTAPTDDVPKACASCTACFASKEARLSMRLPEAWK